MVRSSTATECQPPGMNGVNKGDQRTVSYDTASGAVCWQPGLVTPAERAAILAQRVQPRQYAGGATGCSAARQTAVNDSASAPVPADRPCGRAGWWWLPLPCRRSDPAYPADSLDRKS